MNHGYDDDDGESWHVAPRKSHLARRVSLAIRKADNDADGDTDDFTAPLPQAPSFFSQLLGGGRFGATPSASYVAALPVIQYS